MGLFFIAIENPNLQQLPIAMNCESIASVLALEISESMKRGSTGSWRRAIWFDNARNLLIFYVEFTVTANGINPLLLLHHISEH